jgi:arylsulfatase A-like enzyme
MKHEFITAAAALVSSAAWPQALSSNEAEPRPLNVIYILADDLGWAELGCYGNTFNETPNLDKLAREGMRFTQAYAPAPVCSPDRASLMSGQLPARIGVTDYLRPDTDWHLPDDMVTLPELFKQAGYVTGMAGKWHLSGYDYKGVKSGPGKHGFDEVMVSEQLGIDAGSYFHPYFRVNPRLPAVLGKNEYLTDRLNHEAVQFIKRHRHEPFFFYLSHYAVHTALAAKQDLVDYFSSKPGATEPVSNPNRRKLGTPRGQKDNPLLAAMLKSIDEGVGMIMDELEALGIADNTLIVFTSDNGGEDWVTSNAPLRAGKSHVYEGGIREPLIVKWPGIIQPGSVCDTPTVNVDFYPSCAEILNVPEGPQTLDGVSIVPLLRGADIADRPFFWHYPLAKKHFLGGRSSGAIRLGDWKLVEFFDDHTLELYNLKNDPGETIDLAGQYPEKLKELAALLSGWQHGVSAQFPDGQCPAVP